MAPLGVAVGLIALAPTDARAQLLDLDRPENRLTGETPAAVALSELLLARAGLMEEADPVGAELRRLGAALLNTGRPVPILLGRTMAMRLEELDALADAEHIDEVDRLLLVGGLRAAQDPVPVSTDALDRSVREAMVPLAPDRAALATAWVGERPGTPLRAPSLERAIELVSAHAPEGSGDACDRLASIVAQARERALYAPAGERLSLRFRLAVGVLDDPPEWVPHQSLTDAGAGITNACALMLDPPTRRVGADLLDRYAGMATLIETCDGLETTNETRALRAVLCSRMTDPPALDAIEAASRALDIATGAPELSRDESALVRQLRPLWRSCQRRAVLEERAVVPRVAPVLGVHSPLTDPATLAVLASGSAPTTLARDLIELSALLDDAPDGAPRPRAHGVRASIADRVLAAPIDDEAGIARAAEMVAQMTRDLARGEALARAHTGEDQMSGACVRAQTAMLAAWGDASGDPAPARAAIERLERLATWRRAGAMIGALKSGDSPVQRWPGVQLSGAAVERVSDELEEQVLRAVRLAEGGDGAHLERALDALNARFAVMRLLERLDAGLTRRGGVAGGGGVLAEIALGPPPEDAWQLGQRETLATLCMLCEELASAAIRDDRPAVRDLEDAIRATAERLLRVVERR